MMDLVNQVEYAVVTADRTLPDADSAKRAPMVRRSNKYGMAQDGRYGKRTNRKEEAVRVTRQLLEKYDAVHELAMLDACRDAKMNEHDLCDAFLLALQSAVDVQTGTQPLIGVVRVVGVDPGTRNLAVCLLEVSGLQPVPPQPDGTPRAPDPLFRVLYWALIDTIANHTKARLQSTGDVLRPRHHNIAVMLSIKSERQAEAKKRAAETRKRKRLSTKAELEKKKQKVDE